MSKYSEKEIAIEAIRLIEEEGALSTSELIEALTIRMKPSGHDAEIIKNRKDTYFSQKVRNLKSHKNKIFYKCVVEENDKYYSKEIYKSKTNNTKSKFNVILSKKKKKASAFNAIISDYEKINREKKEIGDAGEEYVLKEQKKRVKKEQPELYRNVKHVSRKEGDGAGYDILSFDSKGKPMYIEVKTTKNKKSSPFYMSANEYAFFEFHKEEFVIARVYEFDKKTKKGKIEYIKGNQINKKLIKEASTYKLYYRD